MHQKAVVGTRRPRAPSAARRASVAFARVPPRVSSPPRASADAVARARGAASSRHAAPARCHRARRRRARRLGRRRARRRRVRPRVRPRRRPRRRRARAARPRARERRRRALATKVLVAVVPAKRAVAASAGGGQVREDGARRRRRLGTTRVRRRRRRVPVRARGGSEIGEGRASRNDGEIAAVSRVRGVFGDGDIHRRGRGLGREARRGVAGVSRGWIARR